VVLLHRDDYRFFMDVERWGGMDVDKFNNVSLGVDTNGWQVGMV
jgi:hypothetical protein